MNGGSLRAFYWVFTETLGSKDLYCHLLIDDRISIGINMEFQKKCSGFQKQKSLSLKTFIFC